jgi:hypothetical protein
MGSALGFDDIDRQISEKIHGTPIEAQFRLAIVQSYERVLHCASKSSSDGGWDNAYPFSAMSWYGSPIRIWSRSSAARSSASIDLPARCVPEIAILMPFWCPLPAADAV